MPHHTMYDGAYLAPRRRGFYMARPDSTTVVTGDVLPPMTELEARRMTQTIQKNNQDMLMKLEETCHLLIELHARQGWKALGYSSWGAFVEAEFKVSASHSYHLLDTGIINKVLIEAGLPPIAMRQAMELAPIKKDPEKVVQTVKRVQQRTEKPTAQDYRAAVQETVRPVPKPGKKTTTSTVKESTPGDVLKQASVIATFTRKLDALDADKLAPVLLRNGVTADDLNDVARWITEVLAPKLVLDS